MSVRTVPRSAADVEQGTCAICTDDPANADVVLAELPCKHSFHPICVDRWLAEKLNQGVDTSCPMCRQDPFAPPPRPLLQRVTRSVPSVPITTKVASLALYMFLALAAGALIGEGQNSNRPALIVAGALTSVFSTYRTAAWTIRYCG